MLDITWYEAQLARIAKQQPNANLATWPVFFKTLLLNGIEGHSGRRLAGYKCVSISKHPPHFNKVLIHESYSLVTRPSYFNA